MKQRTFISIVLALLTLVGSTPALAARVGATTPSLADKVDAQAREIEGLKQEMSALKEQKSPVDAGYDHGFYIRSADKNFMFKIGMWADIFYEYLLRNQAPDSNTFGIRRARFYFSGNMFNPNLTFVIMPELVTVYRTESSIYTTAAGDTGVINDRYDMNWRLLMLYANTSSATNSTCASASLFLRRSVILGDPTSSSWATFPLFQQRNPSSPVIIWASMSSAP